MNDAVAGQRLPRWALTKWLVDPPGEVPERVRTALVDDLYGTIPIFIGGVVNTVAVSSVLAAFVATPLFIAWALAEILLAAIRLPVLIACRRAAREGRAGPTDLYILLAVVWAATVGFGSFISIWSGNWVAAAMACLSSAAMVGGICFRNFAAPRLVLVMITASFGPIAIAGMTSGEPILMLTGFQIPFYLFAMTAAAFKMNRMLVGTMCAEQESDHRARHDALTGLLNRAGLADAYEKRGADEERLACFFLDLDGFKRVNDSLGHAAGDRLLEMVADRLRAASRSGDTIARLGGDEFLVIAPVDGRDLARKRGEGLAAILADLPYLLDGEGVLIGASVGVALRPDHGQDLGELLVAADSALYQAKSDARSRCIVAGPRFPAPYLVSPAPAAAVRLAAVIR